MTQPNEDHKIIAKRETTPDGTQNTQLEAQYYSAPLPHPEMMAEYERIVPGSADRIIKRFEIQSDHRQKCEKIFVWTQSIKSLAGLISGFIIAMTAIVGGIYAAIQGKAFLGGTLSFAGLALLVGAFITDRIFLNKKDNKDEDK